MKKKKKNRTHTDTFDKQASQTKSINSSESLIARWLPPCILAAITYLFYRPSLVYSFQFDDVANIKKFFNIRHSTLSTLFFSGSRWISYWMNTIHFQLARFEPYVYRRTNLCIHTTSGIMLFFVILNALSLLKEESFFKRNRFTLAFVTAGLFLLHPVQTQTVSYVIQGQLEGMATFFTIMIALCFLLYNKTNDFFAKTIYATILFTATFLVTGTKEIAIVTPLLILLLDWFFIAQGNTKSLLQRAWIHALVFTIIWGIYLYFLKPQFFIDLFGFKIEARNNIGNILTENRTDKILPLHYFISQFKVVLHYIWMFIWPFNISVEYDWVLSRSFFAVDSFFPFVALATLSSIIGYLLYKNKTNLIAFGALWFAIAIAPRSSIIPSSELLSDYKTYLPSIGILFLLACAFVKLWEVARTSLESQTPFVKDMRLQYSVFVLLLLPIGFATYTRNKVWRSPSEFWENIIHNAPGKARAYNNYAVALCEQDKYREAVPYYKTAIKMDSSYPDPINNLAVAFSVLGEVDAAIEVLQQGIKLQPRYPEGHNNLASFYINKKDFVKAEECLKRALQLRPYYGKAHFNYGKLCLSQKRNEEAFEHFKAACVTGDLDDEHGFRTYGQVSLQMQKYDDAITAFTQCININPSNSEHVFNLGQAYQAKGEHSKAISLYTQLADKGSEDSRIWYNLGEAYYKQGDTSKALASYTKAKELRHPQPNLYIRMADCLQKLGKKPEARLLLTQLSQMDSVSEQVKQAAQLGLEVIG